MTPVFHIFKTMLFLKGVSEPSFTPLPLGPPVLNDVFKHVLKTGFEKVGKGLSELAGFLS